MATFSDIQQIIQRYGFDAWVLYDFRGSNSIAWNMANLPADAHCTRRWMLVLPAQGEPVKIVHAMERLPLEHVQAREVLYSRKEEWEQAVASQLANFSTIAMEYSPNGELPVIGRVDAGTVEWLRSLGLTIASSADLAQEFTAVWTEKQLTENLQTAKKLREMMMYGFEFIRHNLQQKQQFNEYDVQAAILEQFDKAGLVTDTPPIVSINANAANPHYAPSATQNSPIVYGDTILIDMWAKTADPDSTYADITWMGYAGEIVPDRVASLFAVIRDARNAVVEELRRSIAANDGIRGCDLDDVARAVVDKAGYGQFFFHRTGHNITTEIHGAGVNIDNYETRDTRRILPMTSFSVEPGIYIRGDIGLRTEIDVVLDAAGQILIPSEPMQQEVLALLSPSWKQP